MCSESAESDTSTRELEEEGSRMLGYWMKTPLSTMAWMSEGGPLREDSVAEREWLRSRGWVDIDRTDGTEG